MDIYKKREKCDNNIIQVFNADSTRTDNASGINTLKKRCNPNYALRNKKMKFFPIHYP